MAYLVCIPPQDIVSRENCEKIHNILARVSETYKLNIVPEQVRKKQGTYPDYYKKYRIYKEIREREGGGEAYLTAEEETMILSVCRDEEEQNLMKSCAYAYQYPSTIAVKSFREERREKTGGLWRKNSSGETGQTAEAAPEPARKGEKGERSEKPEKTEKSEKPEKSERAEKNEKSERAARPARTSGRVRKPEKSAKQGTNAGSSSEQAADDSEKKPEKSGQGRRRRGGFARRQRRSAKPENNSTREESRDGII